MPIRLGSHRARLSSHRAPSRPALIAVVIAPSAAKRTPITKAVPGMQLDARIACDPQGQARFLLRLPNDWNGRLVVAGASGTRSEFNGDFAWSDYVVQKGYAYASQNKGVFNLRPRPPRIHWRAGSTRLPVFVHFFDNDPGQPFTRWAEFMVKAAELARDGVKGGLWPLAGLHLRGGDVERRLPGAPRGRDRAEALRRRGRLGRHLRRRARAEHPHRLAAGDPEFPAITLQAWVSAPAEPPRVAGQNIQAAGYPPDIVSGTTSLWGLYNTSFWEVTQCQWQKRLDPTYDTYGSGTGTYNYVSRLSVSDVGAQLAAFATTGDIQRPLVTVAGTMDALLPIDHHARAYARKVAAVAGSEDRGRGKDGDDRGQGNGNDKHQPAYRLYEVQNGNHLEPSHDMFTQLELIEPHAQRAFDLLVRQVEGGAVLPPDQCIPRGGQISAMPAQPGHCANLLAP